MKNKIPQVVIDSVDPEYKITYIGEYEAGKVYDAYIPNQNAGFPKVIIEKNGKTIVHENFIALDIISFFRK